MDLSTFLSLGNNTLTVIALLGILGYVGLFLLFLEHHVNNWLIIAFLLSGSVSFITYMTLDGLWSKIEINNFHIWLFYMLPTIVSLINIVRLINKKLKKRKAI